MSTPRDFSHLDDKNYEQLEKIIEEEGSDYELYLEALARTIKILDEQAIELTKDERDELKEAAKKDDPREFAERTKRVLSTASRRKPAVRQRHITGYRLPYEKEAKLGKVDRAAKERTQRVRENVATQRLLQGAETVKKGQPRAQSEMPEGTERPQIGTLTPRDTAAGLLPPDWYDEEDIDLEFRDEILRKAAQATRRKQRQGGRERKREKGPGRGKHSPGRK